MSHILHKAQTRVKWAKVLLCILDSALQKDWGSWRVQVVMNGALLELGCHGFQSAAHWFIVSLCAVAMGCDSHISMQDHKQSRYLHLPHAGCCHGISELGGGLGARSYFRGHIHTVHTVISFPLIPKPQFCTFKCVKTFSNFFLHPSTGIGSGGINIAVPKWEYSSSSKRLLLSFVLYNRR